MKERYFKLFTVWLPGTINYIKMKKPLKHIGIVGVTAEGAAITYKYICSESEKYFGKYVHPEITIHTFSFSEHIHYQGNRLEKWTDLIVRSVGKLERAGADFVICPSNTPHEVYDQVILKINIPWLNIASEVQKEAIRRNYKKVLLLGTSYTFESNVYPNTFEKCGILLGKPFPEEQQLINAIIVQELVKGQVTGKSQKLMTDILKNYENEYNAVILGCTELPLIIKEERTSMCLLDSTKILGDAAIVESITK